MCVWCLGMCTVNGKIYIELSPHYQVFRNYLHSNKFVWSRSTTLMSVQNWSSRTVLWDYSDLNFAEDTMLSDYPNNETLREQYV